MNISINHTTTRIKQRHTPEQLFERSRDDVLSGKPRLKSSWNILSTQVHQWALTRWRKTTLKHSTCVKAIPTGQRSCKATGYNALDVQSLIRSAIDSQRSDYLSIVLAVLSTKTADVAAQAEKLYRVYAEYKGHQELSNIIYDASYGRWSLDDVWAFVTRNTSAQDKRLMSFYLYSVIPKQKKWVHAVLDYPNMCNDEDTISHYSVGRGKLQHVGNFMALQLDGITHAQLENRQQISNRFLQEYRDGGALSDWVRGSGDDLRENINDSIKLLKVWFDMYGDDVWLCPHRDLPTAEAQASCRGIVSIIHRAYLLSRFMPAPKVGTLNTEIAISGWYQKTLPYHFTDLIGVENIGNPTYYYMLEFKSAHGRSHRVLSASEMTEKQEDLSYSRKRETDSLKTGGQIEFARMISRTHKAQSAYLVCHYTLEKNSTLDSVCASATFALYVFKDGVMQEPLVAHGQDQYDAMVRGLNESYTKYRVAGEREMAMIEGAQEALSRASAQQAFLF